MTRRPDDQIRRRLARSAIENIFKIQIKDDVPIFVKDLFSSLIKFDFDAEHIFTFRELIQKPQNPIILTELFFFLHTYLQTSTNFTINNDENNNEKEQEKSQNQEDSSNLNNFDGEQFFRAIIDSVGINVFNISSLSTTFSKDTLSNDTSTQPLDGKLMRLLYSAGQLASLFIQYIPNFISEILIRPKSSKNDANQEMQIDLNKVTSTEAQCLISFFIITLSFANKSDNHLVVLFEPVIHKLFKKFSLKPIPFSVLVLMSTYKQTAKTNSQNGDESEKSDKRSLKSVISFFKLLGSKSQPSSDSVSPSNSLSPTSSNSNLSSSGNLNLSPPLSDFKVTRILAPIVIRIAISRLSKSILKDLPTLISMCASNIYNDQHALQLFAYFIDQVMTYNEAPQIIKSKSDKIFDLYLQNISQKNYEEIQRTMEEGNEEESDFFVSDEEYNNSDPTNYIKPNIGSAFCLVMEKCKVSPFENGFFASRINEKFVNQVLLMSFYIINHFNAEYLPQSSYESLIPLCFATVTGSLDENIQPDKIGRNFTFQLLIHYCAAIVVKYKSKVALNFLLKSVDKYGSKIASKVIYSNDSDILAFMFPALARALKPDKSNPVLAHTIKHVLKNLISYGVTFSIASTTKQVNQSSLLVSNNNTSSDSSSEASRSNSISSFVSLQHQHSCSNFLFSDNSSSNLSSVSDNLDMHDFERINVVMPDSLIEIMPTPTDTTILFCNVILSIDKHPYLYSLLPFVAGSLSTLFSSELMKHFPKPFFHDDKKNSSESTCNDDTNSDDNNDDSDSSVSSEFQFEVENDLMPSRKSFDDLKMAFLMNLQNRNPMKRKLMKMKYKKFKINHKFKTGMLACYGNALQFLDIMDIYSLSQTLLMFLPGQAMLLLGITLQRLPRSIVSATLVKTIPFILNNPDEAGRMIALVSFAYPDIALSFIENNIIENSPLKKRFFSFSLFSKNNYEKYIQTLIVVFKAIGYCSVFIDINHFVSIFLPFATKFLNQYLSDRYVMSITSSSTSSNSSATNSSNTASSNSSNAASPSNPNSNSNSLHLTVLFAIRKLCTRIGKYQESQMDHVFPFKDFLVQYVSNYYLEIGDLILIENNPIQLISTNAQEDSSSNEKIADTDNGNNNSSNSNASNNPKISLEIIELVPSILSTLSSILQLRPLRPSEKHEKTIELTAFLIQILSKSHKYFSAIIKGSKLFFSALLNCNPSINVFIEILLPIFPALLYHKEWKKIAEMINYLCNKCICHSSDFFTHNDSKWSNTLNLNIQLSGDILSQSINDIEILISYILPLTISKKSCQISFDILYSLVFIQCTIRNQILSLPQSIRPVKPDIDSIINKYNLADKDNECYIEVNSVICSYLTKNFTTSQTFDVIFILLDFFEGKKLKKIHRIGVANSIKILLKERGSEEFKFDSKIISLLINAISLIENEGISKKKQKKKSIEENIDYNLFMKNNFIISIFLEIFELMINMRPFSVLSNIISINDKISEGFLKQLINNVIIAKIEKGGELLLGVIADSFENIEIDVEKEGLTKKFAWRTLPLLYNQIHDINHETWIKLFKGITKNEDVNINDPLIKMLSGVKGNSDYPIVMSLFTSIKNNKVKYPKKADSNDYNSFFSFAKIIAEERILLLPVLHSSFPENPSSFFIKLSIAFAAASKETFFIFIDYAISAIIKNIDFDLFNYLKLIFDPKFVEFEDKLEKIEQINIDLTSPHKTNSNYDLNYSKWAEFCESLTALFIKYMREDKIVIDCSIEFLKRISYSCHHKPSEHFEKVVYHNGCYLCNFWKSLIEVCTDNINSWILIIKKLISEGDVCLYSLSELLPLMIVIANKKEKSKSNPEVFTEILVLIAKKINLEVEIDKLNIENLCISIIKNEFFLNLRIDLLNSFVTLMNHPKYINTCCIMIGNLCDTLTDENYFALSALIGQMPNDDYTYSFVIETLMRLLK